MAQEQFMDRGLTVANAVGDRAVGIAVRVSDLARDDTSKIMAAAGVLVVVVGIRALASGALGKRDRENEVNEQRKENEAKN